MVLVTWFLVQNSQLVGQLLGGFGAIFIGAWLLYALFKCAREERDKLIVVGILILFSLIFWALFEQAGSSLNILTDRGVNRVIFGWEVPASMFQSLNAGFIFTIAPLFALLWIALAKRGMEPSTPIKFSVGIVLVGLGFLALVFGMNTSEGLQTGVLWIVLIYFLHTLGELCLSPVGLSSVTKLSPQRIVGFMMGMWFFCISSRKLCCWLDSKSYCWRCRPGYDTSRKNLSSSYVSWSSNRFYNQSKKWIHGCLY